MDAVRSPSRRAVPKLAGLPPTSRDRIHGEAKPAVLVRRPRRVATVALVLGGAVLAGRHFDATGVIGGLITAVLVLLAAIDIERRVIPNVVVLPATTLVLITNVAFFPGRSIQFVLAALAASIAFLIPNLINRSLMGMGDVKLALFLGAGLGWSVVGAVTVAFLSVFPVALGMLLRGGMAARKASLPFGPFLAVGGIVILLLPALKAIAGG